MHTIYRGDYLKEKIGFIGFGSMGQALADGLLAAGIVKKEQLYACAQHWEKLKHNTETRGMHACKTAEDTILQSDIILIAIKPDQIPEVLGSVKELLSDKIVISLAAGMFYDTYELLLLPKTHHLSIIPNMPVSVCEGIILWEQHNSLNAAEAALVEALLSSVALIEKLDSEQMTIGATVAGCGPAFAAMFVEAVGDGAVAYGLPREAGYRLCEQMLTGTAKQLMVQGMHPAVLKDRVSAPKGTTIQGVAELERLGFRNTLISAINTIEQYRLK
ncbi:pyrroline-5-carboxylate reductase [Erysipelotrichaceae bacterium AF15-26LB]|nr:pyrroline-5-carboxylate reductase [Erysipelotrichaceae bacterium 3_1_53]RJV84436.1 pyrroline-5-carboxylate reductase [Erysipelotrichaceae bacterium AF15-26LB]RJV86352.1 pyrroline-5-carboxylate reductase [Erysipelotrichaceae bacterium AF19-24AC]